MIPGGSGPCEVSRKDGIQINFFISLRANVGDDFQSLFQKGWAAPRGESERVRESGIGEDLVSHDHDQWMIGIIKLVRLMDEENYRMTNVSMDDPFLLCTSPQSPGVSCRKKSCSR